MCYLEPNCIDLLTVNWKMQHQQKHLQELKYILIPNHSFTVFIPLIFSQNIFLQQNKINNK